MQARFKHFYSVPLYQPGWKMLVSWNSNIQFCSACAVLPAPPFPQYIWFFLQISICSLPFPIFILPPDWNLCCQIAARFLKSDKKTVDLVGNEKMKASTNVRHIIIPCSSSARTKLIPDVIRCYSRLVFYGAPNYFLVIMSFQAFAIKLLINPLDLFPLWYVIDSVEGVLLFSLRQRILLLNFLAYCPEHVLCTGTYNKLSERYVNSQAIYFPLLRALLLFSFKLFWGNVLIAVFLKANAQGEAFSPSWGEA